MEDKIFRSASKVVPPIRSTLDVFPVHSGDRQLMYFHDSMGYATENFAVDKSIAGLLPLIDGKSSVKKIVERIQELGGQISEKELGPFITMLDENRMLFSEYFKAYKTKMEDDFEQSEIREPICAGTSYSKSPEKLRAQFDMAFEAVSDQEDNPGKSKIKALYAPHIDPRVGLETYAKAFKPLSNLKPKHVIILGTAHYAGSYFDYYDNTPFILSQKKFSTPLGTISTQKEFAEALISNSDKLGLSVKDRAHRIEHSLELHLIFLQYMWNHDFEITPILVNSFDELMYKKDGALGDQLAKMGEILSTTEKDEDTLILISGDLAHFGHKFGDTEKASEMFNEVKLFDGQFLEQAKNVNSDGLLSVVSEVYDRYRVCGFSPLYSWLASKPNVTGEVTGYQLWDERERESAVTFGSILFRQN